MTQKAAQDFIPLEGYGLWGKLFVQAFANRSPCMRRLRQPVRHLGNP